MALFQKSVVNKYLKQLDEKAVSEAYGRFQDYFHNPETQTNIRKASEIQFQQKFLIELFVNVLGYIMNPDPQYDLTTEFNNEKGAKKADGAILDDGKAIGVIELKGTDTKDLDKINAQAFNYKNNQSNCVYVITSNFEKLRFFIHDAVEHEEFNLFKLTEDDFKLLWLCLEKNNVFAGIPLKLKKESLLKEETDTKLLYADYSVFKRELWEDMVKRNPKYDELLLFKKSQKLLDRFLFIFFSEDKGLLPPNSISRIIKRWEVLKEEDAYKPLYGIFKQYFGYMDIGRKGKVSADDISAYNGGLFRADEVLDTVEIDDELLRKHTIALTNYDFDSEIDVNILGHIFEHSLSEIENVRARLEGIEVDKSKTKRKKDGIFYTPKYITKYIVDNTVGKLCEEKRKEFGIEEEKYAKGRQHRKKEIVKRLVKQLEAYRKWLLNITICDPACGSGAFLNQALDFLMKEHYYLDELQATLLGGFLFPDVEKHILENNLFGVDINEESIDIAKLALWLRTAQKGRTLTTLSGNIKCGNSLIDDVDIAGEKAFDWKKEFPKVFEKGGFDVVIGNPPYVRAELLGEFRGYLEKKYKVFEPASDLFSYFYEKSFLVLNENGYFGFISNTFDKTTAGKALRAYLQSNVHFVTYVDFTEVKVFEGATTYPIIFIAQKHFDPKNEFDYVKIPKERGGNYIDIGGEGAIEIVQHSLDADNWSFVSKASTALTEKIKKHKTVREKYGKCYRGLITGLNEAFLTTEKFPLGEHIKAVYEGKEIKKWHTPETEQKLILFKSRWTREKYGEDIIEDSGLSKLKSDFPDMMNHLIPFEEKAKKRHDKGEFWWELRNCAYYDLFEKPKIIFPNLQNANKFCYDDKEVHINAPAVFLPTDDKALLCILNSKLVWYFLKSICVVRSGGYIEVKPQYFEQIPIPEYSPDDVNKLVSKADFVMEKVTEQQKLNSKVIKLLQTDLGMEKVSKKLASWHKLDWVDFEKELKKQKVNLTLNQKSEWMDFFEVHKQKAQGILNEINTAEKEIDRMVYELYGLSEEEIKVAKHNYIEK